MGENCAIHVTAQYPDEGDIVARLDTFAWLAITKDATAIKSAM